jgi:hypothetical protein
LVTGGLRRMDNPILNRRQVFVPIPRSIFRGHGVPQVDVQLKADPSILPTTEAQLKVVAAANVVHHRKHSMGGNAIRPLPAGMVQQPLPPVAPVFLTPDVDFVQVDRVRGLRGRGRGKFLVIIGNGPSIVEIDLPALSGHPRIDLMSINKPDPRIWPTQLWSFCDACIWQRHEQLWNAYTGLAITSTGIEQTKPNSVKIKALYGDGFSRKLDEGYYVGHSTVFASMQVALWMDYDRVFLFGVDMAALTNPDGTKRVHFYGTNPDVDPEERIKRFGLEAKYYDEAAERLSEADRKRFTFCSNYNPWPFVDKFSRLDHTNAVAEILKVANQE